MSRLPEKLEAGNFERPMGVPPVPPSAKRAPDDAFHYDDLWVLVDSAVAEVLPTEVSDYTAPIADYFERELRRECGEGWFVFVAKTPEETS